MLQGDFERNADLSKYSNRLEQYSVRFEAVAVDFLRRATERPWRQGIRYGRPRNIPHMSGAATTSTLSSQNATGRPSTGCGPGIQDITVFSKGPRAANNDYVRNRHDGLVAAHDNVRHAQGVAAVSRKCMNHQAAHREPDLVAVVRSEVGRFQCRGLRREDAAAYIGISPVKFDDWVKRRLMPHPKRQDGVVIWDRFALDLAFGTLPDDSDDTDAEVWKDLKA